jgi:two-component system, chemotaxis family, sensor kinase Cph1
LNELLRDVLSQLSIKISDSGARIEIPRPLPQISCDPIRTAAIFENLITNALKYNDKPEKLIEIGYTATPIAATTFYVRDNGIGVPKKHQEQIFRIFCRLHGRDEYGGGSGAGLTIARIHTKRQGGRIWLESEPNQGATFYFTLDSRLDAPTIP